MANTTRIRAVRHDPAELTDTQIETLMAFGRREAELLAELQSAVETDDRELAWQIAQALIQVEDQVRAESGG